MQKKSDETKFQPSKDLFLVISFFVLIVFTTLFLWITVLYYQKRVKAISFNETRFLTTEWRLLQELKAQSDQKLLEKEEEIEELNRRLLELSRGNASPLELEEIKRRLEKAKAEREEILANRREASSSDPDPKQKAWIAELLPSENQSAITRVLEKQIESLEEKLVRNQQYIRELEKKLGDITEKQESMTQEYTQTIEEQYKRIEELSATVAKLSQDFSTALKDIKQRADTIEIQEQPRIEDLTTRSLVRAIISSPAVQEKYPDLLDSLDRYFEVYGEQEYLKGQLDAYATTAEKLESLITTPGGL